MCDGYLGAVGVVALEHADVSLQDASLPGLQLDEARVQVRVHCELDVRVRSVPSRFCGNEKRTLEEARNNETYLTLFL